jgi:hypothetical protein
MVMEETLAVFLWKSYETYKYKIQLMICNLLTHRFCKNNFFLHLQLLS